MRTILISLCIFFATAHSALAEDPIPQDVLNKIKAATVFIKVKTNTGRGTGSGFLIQVDRGKYFVITNEHVVVHEERQTAKGKSPNRTEIEVVFASGTDVESTFTAEIVAADAAKDLAILRLNRTGWGKEEGLDFAADVKLSETLPVCMLGFPFGRALAGAKRGNPAVTIGRGSISSIRDDKKRGRVIQIDGDLNPGNSGGPVVDTQGRLIGVAVAKVSGTNIGFVVPAGEIAGMLDPAIPLMKVVMDRQGNGVIPIRCELDLIDPVNRFEKLAVRYAPAAGREAVGQGEKSRTWSELVDAQTASFDIARRKATAAFSVPVNGPGPVTYLVQLIATTSDNTVWRSEPLAVAVEPSRSAQLVPKNRAGNVAGRAGTLIEYRRPAKVALGAVKIESVAIDGLFSQSQLVWSNDGKALFHIAQDGVVRRLSCPGLKEEASAPTNLKTNLWLTPSAVGLVVSGIGDLKIDPTKRDRKPPFQGLMVLDFSTLKPIRTIEAAGLQRTVSAPGAKFAYGLIGAVRGKQALAVYDLTGGEIVRKYPLAELGVPETAMRRLAVTPDCRWLLSRDAQRLFRFKIDGADVKLDFTSQPILGNDMYHELSVSYDGQWLEANFVHDEEIRKRSAVHNGTPNCTFDLFAVNDLTKPALTWSVFNSPGQAGAGFDRANGYVYAHTGNNRELQAFDRQGNLVGQYDTVALSDSQRSVKQTLVHPDGRHVAYLLAESESRSQRIALVELLPAAPEN